MRAKAVYARRISFDLLSILNGYKTEKQLARKARLWEEGFEAAVSFDFAVDRSADPLLFSLSLSLSFSGPSPLGSIDGPHLAIPYTLWPWSSLTTG